MPTKLCLQPKCGNHVKLGYCPDHQRPQAHQARISKAAQRKIYNSSHWKNTRTKQLFDHPLCNHCGIVAQEVDHITPLTQGGSPYGFDNLQSLCRPCHFEKTRTENTTNRPAPKMRALLILVGPRGAGKSTIRALLTTHHGVPSASPDDYDDGWLGINRLLWANHYAIVECCRIPPMLLRTLGPTTTIVHLQAPRTVLAARLNQRADIKTQDIPKYLREATDRRASFHAEVAAHLEIETTTEPQALAAAITEHLHDRNPAFPTNPMG